MFDLLETGPYTRYKSTTEFDELLIGIGAYESLDLNNVSPDVLKATSARSKFRRPSLAPSPTFRQQQKMLFASLASSEPSLTFDPSTIGRVSVTTASNVTTSGIHEV